MPKLATTAPTEYVDLDNLDMMAVITEAAAAYKRAKVAIKATGSSFRKEDVRYATFKMVLDKHVEAYINR